MPIDDEIEAAVERLAIKTEAAIAKAKESMTPREIELADSAKEFIFENARLRERIEALQSLLPEGIQIANNAATSSRNGWTIGRSEGKRAEAFVEAARKLLEKDIDNQ